MRLVSGRQENVYYLSRRRHSLITQVQPRDLIKARVIAGKARCPCLSDGGCVYSAHELNFFVTIGRFGSLTKNIVSYSVLHLSAQFKYFSLRGQQQRKVRSLVKGHRAEHVKVETEWDTEDCLEQKVTIYRHT